MGNRSTSTSEPSPNTESSTPPGNLDNINTTNMGNRLTPTSEPPPNTESSTPPGNLDNTNTTNNDVANLAPTDATASVLPINLTSAAAVVGNVGSSRNTAATPDSTSQESNNNTRPNRQTKKGLEMSAKRIKRELAEMNLDPLPNCSARMKSDDLYELVATILGPPESVYEGGEFSMDIRLSPEYPFKPPTVTFRTRIYHCNINSRGVVCLDILSRNWSPALTISKILLSIISLLADCNPDDPLVGSIAHQYKQNREEHDKTARLWTKIYAAKS